MIAKPDEDSRIVLAGRFRVYRNGTVNKMTKNGEVPANLNFIGRLGKYAIISYTSEKKQKHVYVHRLVAMTFVPNPNGFLQINHIDGNTLNNSADNLEWVTSAMNSRHALEEGLRIPTVDYGICQICGDFTKDLFCPNCQTLVNVIRSIREKERLQIEDFSGIDESLLTKKQKEYVNLAKIGLSYSEIARVKNVSKQIVYKTLSTILIRKEIKNYV